MQEADNTGFVVWGRETKSPTTSVYKAHCLSSSSEKGGLEIFSVTSTQWAFQCFLKHEHWSLDPASWVCLQEPSIAFRFHLALKFGGFKKNFFLEKLLHDLIF